MVDSSIFLLCIHASESCLAVTACKKIKFEIMIRSIYYFKQCIVIHHGLYCKIIVILITLETIQCSVMLGKWVNCWMSFCLTISRFQLRDLNYNILSTPFLLLYSLHLQISLFSLTTWRYYNICLSSSRKFLERGFLMHIKWSQVPHTWYRPDG